MVRSVSGALEKDRFLSPDIEAVTKLLQEERVCIVDIDISHYHNNNTNNMCIYKFLIAMGIQLIWTFPQVWKVVKPYMDNYDEKQLNETFVNSPTASYPSESCGTDCQEVSGDAKESMSKKRRVDNENTIPKIRKEHRH